jgi:hypothetical protein
MWCRGAFAHIDVVARIGHASRGSSAVGHIDRVPCVTICCHAIEKRSAELSGSENISRIPSVLTGRLRERGFAVEVTRRTETLCVIATPQSADGPARPG